VFQASDSHPRSQSIIGGIVLAVSLLLAWQLGTKIAVGDNEFLIYSAVLAAGAGAIVATLHNWRFGFYIFFFWMMFEDLFRKYMGNGPALFFGKDILLLFVYLSYFIAVRRRREKLFRPEFLPFFMLFFWLGVGQLFNQHSPSILYGLLGLKIYFYYVPLLFIGYSLIRTDEDLMRFLKVNAWLTIPVCVVGITQSIVGNSFLNPGQLAPELQDLGDLQKTNSAGQIFNLPDSIFVSAGRYTQYLPIAFILAMGATGYLLMYSRRNRGLAFLTMGMAGIAALLSGNRGCTVAVVLTMVLLSVGFLWGAPWQFRQGHRVLKAVRRSFVVAVAAVVIAVVFFPETAGSRVAYYAETLLPSGNNFEVTNRAWDYPMANLMAAFTRPNWVLGNGIGTASLGTQYVKKLTGTTPPPIGVEEGYAALIVQMGIIAPFVWLLWTCALIYYSWKKIRTLRGSRFFPVALCIGWYTFLLLFLWTYGSLVSFENYTCSVFLWLLIGVLARLPELNDSPPAV
jgi:hypothetical protein